MGFVYDEPEALPLALIDFFEGRYSSKLQEGRGLLQPCCVLHYTCKEIVTNSWIFTLMHNVRIPRQFGPGHTVNVRAGTEPRIALKIAMVPLYPSSRPQDSHHTLIQGIMIYNNFCLICKSLVSNLGLCLVTVRWLSQIVCQWVSSSQKLKPGV